LEVGRLVGCPRDLPGGIIVGLILDARIACHECWHCGEPSVGLGAPGGGGDSGVPDGVEAYVVTISKCVAWTWDEGRWSSADVDCCMVRLQRAWNACHSRVMSGL